MATCLISELRSRFRSSSGACLYVKSKNIRKMMMNSYMEDFNMLKRISFPKRLFPSTKRLRRHSVQVEEDGNGWTCSSTSLDEDMTKYKIDLFRDEEIVISGQHLCKQSVQVGPFRKTSKSELPLC